MLVPVALARLCRRLIPLTLLSIPLLPLSALACSGVLHIEIEAGGVYALDHAAIAERQPDLADCASDQLSLNNAGKEVPIRVLDGGDGKVTRQEFVDKPNPAFVLMDKSGSCKLDGSQIASARSKTEYDVSGKAPQSGDPRISCRIRIWFPRCPGRARA